MTSASGEAFLFGKLPAHGDFVSRGLAEASRAAWDDWATAALERLRAGADDFEASHDAIPPFRFIAGPSLLGGGWRIGALTPSIDAAGRRFVLVAGIEGCAAERAGGLGLLAAAAVEDLLYRALGERLTADALVSQIDAALKEAAADVGAAQALAAAPVGPGVWWTPGVEVRVSAAPPIDLLAAARDARFREPAA